MISYQNKMMISALSSMVENPRRLTSNCNSVFIVKRVPKNEAGIKSLWAFD